MLKISLIAAALAIAGAASAQDMRAQSPYDYGAPRTGYGYGGNSSSDGGLGRYCPPGFYPHSFPNGNGIRCETTDGSIQFDGY